MYHSTSAVTANVCKLALTTQFNTSNGSSGTSCPSPGIYMVVMCTYCPSIYPVVGEEFTAQTAFPSAALIKVPRQKEKWQKSVSQQHLGGAVMHGDPLCYITQNKSAGTLEGQACTSEVSSGTSTHV